MIVEFIGLPGSGKSTISHEVYKHFTTCSISIQEPARYIAHQGNIRKLLIKNFYILLGAALCPLVSIDYCKILFKSRQQTGKDFLVNLYNGLFLVGIYGKHHRSRKVILLDQGGLQALWSILYSSTLSLEKKILLSKKYPDIFFPSLVLYVYCQDEEIVKRLGQRKRKQSRLEQSIGTFPDLSFFTDNMVLIIEVLNNRLDKNFETHFVQLNNDHIADLTNNTSRAIKAILRSSSERSVS